MSATTISQVKYRGLTNPDDYLDTRAGAVLTAQGQEGIGGWVFDIPTGESIDLDADVSDHYVENGSFVSDHVVLKPIVINLKGFKGELLYTKPASNTLTGVLSNATSLLGAVPAYFGPLTPGAATKIAVIANYAQYAASQAEAIAKRASNLVKYFSGEDNAPNLQTKAFITLQAMWKSKQIVTVQTPWGFYKNMIIQHVSPKQDESSNDYTDFTVTLKEMRFTDIKKTTFDAEAYKGDIDKLQAADAAKNGKAAGAAVDDTDPFYKAFTPGQKYMTPDGVLHAGIN
jgi:hypothetical protein